MRRSPYDLERVFYCRSPLPQFRGQRWVCCNFSRHGRIFGFGLARVCVGFDLRVSVGGSDVPETDLKHAAVMVRENAHAPYSNFKVGAAIRSSSGTVYVGCNVENVAYPEGTCAEAGAIAAMVAAGETRLTEVYVVADSPMPVTPCGGCRQKLAEFGAGDVAVIMATVAGVEQAMTLADLLPGAFGAAHMER